MKHERFDQAIRVYVWYRLKQKHAIGRSRRNDAAKAEVIGEVCTVLMEKEPGRNELHLRSYLDELVDEVRRFGPRPMKDWRYFFAIMLLPFALLAANAVIDAPLPALWMALGVFGILTSAFLGWLALLWRPYLSAMKRVCRQGGYGLQLLQALTDLQVEPRGQVIRRYCLPQLAVYAAVALMLSAWPAALNGVRKARADAYHAEMAAVTVSAECAGTRYTVYDADAQRYVDGYLNEAYRAETAQDVRAVFRLTEETRQVMSDDNSRRFWRVCVIELIDQRSGDTVLTETVYGSTPGAASSNAEKRQTPKYGSRPARAEISDRIGDMIRRYEAGDSAD